MTRMQACVMRKGERILRIVGRHHVGVIRPRIGPRSFSLRDFLQNGTQRYVMLNSHCHSLSRRFVSWTDAEEENGVAEEAREGRDPAREGERKRRPGPVRRSTWSILPLLITYFKRNKALSKKKKVIYCTVGVRARVRKRVK